MKSIKDIRQNLEILAEEADNVEIRKLTALVKAGLFDSNKISLLKRALNKENIRMSKVEKDVLLELLDRLLSIVLSNQSIFSKVKQNVSESNEEYFEVVLDESDGRYSTKTMTNIDITQVPPIIVMKRKSIRIFPDGQKVALYWADRINKYISVPFQSIGISEEVSQKLDELQQMHLNRLQGKEREARTAEKIAQKSGETRHIQAATKARKDVEDYKAKLDTGFSGPKAGRKQRIQQAHELIKKSMTTAATQRRDAAKKRLGAWKEKKTKEYSDKKKEFDKASTSYQKKVSNRGQGFGKDYARHGLGGAIGLAIHRKITSAPSAPKAPEKPKFMKEDSSVSLKFKSRVQELKEQNQQQLDEILPVVGAAIATGARIAAPYVARAAGALVRKAAPYAKRAAGAVARKAKALGKKGLKKIKDYVKSKKGALGAAAGYAAGSAGSDSSGSDSSSKNYEYDVKRDKAFGGSGPIKGINPENRSDVASQERRDKQQLRRSMSMQENVITKLKNLTETINLEYEDGTVEVTPSMAEKIVEIYDALNVRNKKIVREMINKDKSNFVKIANFAANKV